MRMSDTHAEGPCQIRRVGISRSQDEIGGQGGAAGGTSSSAHDARPALGEALLSEAPLAGRLAPVDEYRHALTLGQAIFLEDLCTCTHKESAARPPQLASLLA